MQMIGHYFHLNETISVGIADLLNYLLESVLYLIFYHLVAILWTEHDMVVDIIHTVVRSSIHDQIILYVLVFEKTDRPAGDAPFIPPHKGVGFQGRGSIKRLPEMEAFYLLTFPVSNRI